MSVYELVNTSEFDDFLSDYNEFLLEKKEEGKKLVGFIAHENFPYEIFKPLDMVPVPFIFAGTESLTNSGAEFLTPSMCPFALSQIGRYNLLDEIRGFKFLKNIDIIISTNYCSADMLAMEAAACNFGIKHIYFHIPFIYHERNAEYFARRILELIGELADATGKKPDYQKIAGSIIRNNLINKIAMGISELDIKGSDKNRIVQFLLLMGDKEDLLGESQGDISVSGILEKIRLKFGSGYQKWSENKIKVILTGASSFLGDSLYELIENAGGNVVADNTWIFRNFRIRSEAFNQLIETSGKKSNQISVDKISAENKKEFISEYYKNLFIQNLGSPHVTPEGDFLDGYISETANLARKYNTDMIINHIVKFCDIVGHHRDEFKSRLVSLGFKVLNLEKDFSRSMTGQLRTRIEAFLEMAE